MGTPDGAPWNQRASGRLRRADDQRSSFAVDRDRIIHSSTFRELQYKTQVQGLINPDWSRGIFRTRLNHVLEVAQIARGLARGIGADEALAEAIALAHDLGHPPFGHAGEKALGEALVRYGRPGWNANVHSLAVVDTVEAVFIDRRGLDLTWATREGIARHSTPFDEPVSLGEFSETPNGGIECQIVDLADVFAYLSHDVDDGLQAGYISLESLASASEVAAELVEGVGERWATTINKPWPDDERENLSRRWIAATLIYRLIDDAVAVTRETLQQTRLTDATAIRANSARVVQGSQRYMKAVHDLLGLLVRSYYRSADVQRTDRQASQVVGRLMDALIADPALVPARFHSKDTVVDAATYLASLNDHSAIRLAELLALPIEADTPQTTPLLP